jgi:lysozyme
VVQVQTKTASNIKVIDVSHHQNDKGKIDWKAVKADGVAGAFIKATEGGRGIDLKFSSNAQGAPLAGLKVGFYHYAHPELNDPYTEAVNFFKTVKTFKADFPHVLDVEGEAAGNKDLAAWCVTWLQEVEKLSGHPAMIYTGASFARSYLGKALAKWPLWVAHYGTEQPMANNTWDAWAAFQYSSTGTVAGITGNVDVNAMEKAFFDKYAGTEAKPKMNQKDAESIIKLLAGAYELTKDKEARDEIHRLGNEIRKAAGIPTT